MKRNLVLITAIAVLGLVSGTLGATAARLVVPPPAPPPWQAGPLSPVGSGFTYQGQLLTGGTPASGNYDFVFRLYDAASGGSLVGGPLALPAQPVSAGLFTVALDFGSQAFLGEGRWLEIDVRPAGSGSYTTLSPRQPLTATPYALSAPWSGLANKPAPYSSRRLPNTKTTLDSVGFVGYYSSATIGSDGLGLISYYDYSNSALKIAHCEDPTCATATLSTLDSAGTVGEFSSITIGSDGLGLIAYYDRTTANGEVKVAHCNNLPCTAATLSFPDGNGLLNVGQYTALTIGSNGWGIVGYYDLANNNLRMAFCQDILCTSAGLQFPFGPSGRGQYLSATIGGDGRNLFSFYNMAGQDLQVAHCADEGCGSITISTLDSAGDVGRYTSATVGSDGLGLISYYDATNGHLKVAHCNNPDCTAATLTTLDSGTQTGRGTAITIGADGLGAIAYVGDNNEGLKFAHCVNPACTAATIVTLEDGNTGVEGISLRIGADGLPLISYNYADDTSGGLRVLHCGSPQCVAYQNQR